jgi:hypothetical protein
MNGKSVKTDRSDAMLCPQIRPATFHKNAKFSTQVETCAARVLCPFLSKPELFHPSRADLALLTVLAKLFPLL